MKSFQRFSVVNSTQFFEALVDNAADAICVVDLKGRISYVNHTWEKLFKESLSKVQGQHFKHFLVKSSVPLAMSSFQKAQGKLDSFKEEFQVLDARGEEIPVEVSISPLFLQGKVIGVHGIVRDIRSKYAERLRKVEQDEKLLLESRMLAIKHLVAGSAKEIQYPLEVTLKRISEVLKRYENRPFEYVGFKEFKDLMKTLNLIYQQINHSNQVTQRLLSFYKKKAGIDQQSSDVNKIIQESFTQLTNEIKISKVKLRSKLHAKLPLVKIGPVELKQVVVNILMNALQAMPSGGVVNVLSRLDLTRDQVMIQVKDQGVGIPKENLANIFDPFFTTKGHSSGTNPGLGLSIVYSIVKAYDGDIVIESSLRSGTCVQIFLPFFSLAKTRETS